MDKLRSIYASACSATVTIIAVVAMTIGAELSPAFKNWLAGFTGHHWVTKSWISILVFALLFCVIRFAGKSASESQTKRALITLEIATALGFLAILGFYVYEFFAH
ncbi:hypothetical protein A3H65_00565 [Candidatus Giovannonibacteria bacterium RIFCSPLOWO2_02_FULL_45_14]|uniref:Uncharacterized protein n=1 Tax=Candidatus Giovannonibacteria bacterium RIFCSPLOWO2_12_FULL_44_15 TaxID=1798364 RepID=A0A1F5Y0K8_9BACT|nr:MAG: hypothetical protein A3C75_02850 [Candidatus Giovannonibacteria bacterium RIFCSPHIGHO2_02_FULL_44_31]OGF76766.1 MAG: hypothetical protein A3E62_02465 [Candidatus Giovannonibacteria bacterium RIFCSPHIGHO2_12_FULL_44_29]OGF90958.1 MAG: hypothetical protein A3H65_00565 [Candidatus Giovannonibacteria bacterium RIFCSPLOWO2_02_FULL_45_14]OGF93705.1 MAG: hypothetical protein A3G54_02055 [Candidatus Giovannonibacteria bacterium RIFCSPLOWO2_12_FULL_44_15]